MPQKMIVVRSPTLPQTYTYFLVLLKSLVHHYYSVKKRYLVFISVWTANHLSPANVLTKPLLATHFSKLRRNMK